MKKLIAALYGAQVHASNKNIKGRKSQGVEDVSSSYKNWAERKGNVRDHN